MVTRAVSEFLSERIAPCIAIHSVPHRRKEVRQRSVLPSWFLSTVLLDPHFKVMIHSCPWDRMWELGDRGSRNRVEEVNGKLVSITSETFKK